MALADMGEMLDQIAGHRETDSPTANLREALVGQLRPLWTSGS
jgi:hypothetical protein